MEAETKSLVQEKNTECQEINPKFQQTKPFTCFTKKKKQIHRTIFQVEFPSEYTSTSSEICIKIISLFIQGEGTWDKGISHALLKT